jgi:hypothetical protein
MAPPSTIIVTMAGDGERFRREGYRVPKFRIEAKGRSLFHWAVVSLSNFWSDDDQMVFVCRREHDPATFLERECGRLGIRNYDVLLLDAATDGQATTALRGGAAVRDPARPVLIYNIDTHVTPGELRPEDVRGDGWIPCFPGEGTAWSFADAGPDGLVRRVAEKVRISSLATIGLYWFSSFARFEQLYENRFRTARSGEKYIAPMYNTLIAEGGAVYVQSIPAAAVRPLGTPAEVRAFEAATYEIAVTQ